MIVILGMLTFSERTWKHHCVTLMLPFAVLCYYLAACQPTVRVRTFLIVALVAVILLGALIAGAFVATAEESRVSLNAVLAERSLNAAESAAEEDVAGWASQQTDSLIVGQRKARSWSTQWSI